MQTNKKINKINIEKLGKFVSNLILGGVLSFFILHVISAYAVDYCDDKFCYLEEVNHIKCGDTGISEQNVFILIK